MRSLIIVGILGLTLSACATQAPTETKVAVAPETNAAAPVKAPQCWNGDAAKFEDVGVTAQISGITVVCDKTADGKNAQWMGVKK